MNCFWNGLEAVQQPISAKTLRNTRVTRVLRNIGILRDSGYSGWLTVEHFGARDMLKAAKESFGLVAACLVSK